jgi:hypothetical protein
LTAWIVSVNDASAIKALALFDPRLAVLIIARVFIRTSVFMTEKTIDHDSLALIATKHFPEALPFAGDPVLIGVPPSVLESSLPLASRDFAHSIVGHHATSV